MRIYIYSLILSSLHLDLFCEIKSSRRSIRYLFTRSMKREDRRKKEEEEIVRIKTTRYSNGIHIGYVAFLFLIRFDFCGIFSCSQWSRMRNIRRSMISKFIN